MSTSGEVPTSVEEVAANAAAFIQALGVTQVDVLGFSLGGLVAQTLTLAEPELVRRLVLVGTGPRSGEGMASLTPRGRAGVRRSMVPVKCMSKTSGTPSALPKRR